MKIYAPVKTANGVYASVRFVNGVGETNDPALIEWFRSHGYHVSGNFTTTPIKTNEDQLNQFVENELPSADEVGDEPEVAEEVELMGYSDKPKSVEEMTPNELRQWMVENGYGSKIRNTRSKEKLLEILRG